MSNLNIRVARTIGRHFVTLSCIQHPPEDASPKSLLFSGFLIEILGEWFYVTAGHIIRDVRAAMSTGSEFDVWRLDDQTAGNRFCGKAVPYAFDPDAWLVLQDDGLGFDYAAAHIHPFYRRQLEAGGAMPIKKEIWADHVAAADYWVLVGIPSESVAYDGETVIRARVVMMPLRAAETPELAAGKEANQFYATPMGNSGTAFKDADGLSGGPVFALKKVTGTWCYGVIGVQSAWYRSSRTLAICPVSSFGLALEPVIAEALGEYQRIEGTGTA
jgi:hypothetical protein